MKTAKRALSEHRTPASTSHHKLLSLDDARGLANSGSFGAPYQQSPPSGSAVLREPMQKARIQRWAGQTRTVEEWDSLRRDPELFSADGDCYVHLYARGVSRRGPSFCVPFKILQQKECHAMISQCAVYGTTSDGESQQLSEMHRPHNTTTARTSTIQLFIPAPDGIPREDSFRWHVATRNFFALLMGKPLVGEHMGQTFVDLQDRLFLYRPDQSDNRQEFLDYLEGQGYRDLVNCADYALASLYYAEHYKDKVVWIDAFAHCVGMNKSLTLSPEYNFHSKPTKVLLTRASLEVELHLNRVWIAVVGFLQEDLSPSYLGITNTARNHLNYFRRFLLNFYADEFGCWPPPHTTSFPKTMYKCLQFDFQSLYEYLVDKESTSDISLQKPPTVGGLCVLQNVNSLDRRNGFQALPYPLPLLPAEKITPRKSKSQKTLRQFALATQHDKTYRIHATSTALAAATNAPDHAAARSKIVEAYTRFEKEYATSAYQRNEKISATDARKVTWLLIYGILQHLNSALQAPKEVRDCESSQYPLCCVAERPSWHTGSRLSTSIVTLTTTPSMKVKDLRVEDRRIPHIIEPDCNREDYISSDTIRVELSRQSSFRSLAPRSLSVGGPQSAAGNSESKALHNHPASTPDMTHDPSEEDEYMEVPIFSGYSLFPQHTPLSHQPDGVGSDMPWLVSTTPTIPCDELSSSDGSIYIFRSRTPLLDSSQLEIAFEVESFKAASDASSRSDSTGSTASSAWSEPSSAVSSQSSTGSEAGSPIMANPVNFVENSGLLGGLVSLCGTPIGHSQANLMTLRAAAKVSQANIHPLLRKNSRPNWLDFNFEGNQPESTTNAVEIESHDPKIGVAISAGPTRHCLDPQSAELPLRTKPSTTEKHNLLTPETGIEEPIISSPKTGLRRMRSAHFISTITSPTSDMWEQYKHVLTRSATQPERHTDNVDPLDATPPPISISKNTTITKISSFRFSLKKEIFANAGEKKSSKLSSFWRRS